MALITKQGYPQYRTDKNGVSLIDVVYGAWTEVLAYEGLIGTPSTTNPIYALDVYTKRRDESGTMGEIEQIYVLGNAIQAGTDTNKPEPSCQVAMFEKPLEQHPDYLNKWNYHLACREDATTEDPSWWDTSGAAGGTFMDDGGEPESYRWIKDPSELPQEEGHTWKIIKKKTKPGIESFFSPSVTVFFKYYYSDYAKASTASADAGKRQTPEYTFGRTGGEWLNMGSSVYKDGRKWVMETSWQFSENNRDGQGWDNDLYEEAAT
jgi:hypothetical protein